MCSNSASWFKYDDNPTNYTTTTREAYGLKKLSQYRPVAKREINFFTFPVQDQTKITPSGLNSDMLTIYKRDYPPMMTNICKPLTPKETNAHPLFNRRALNEFQNHPWAPTKFMDDNFVCVSDNRKIINFFRQLRNRSLLFDEFPDEYKRPKEKSTDKEKSTKQEKISKAK